MPDRTTPTDQGATERAGEQKAREAREAAYRRDTRPPIGPSSPVNRVWHREGFYAGWDAALVRAQKALGQSIASAQVIMAEHFHGGEEERIEQLDAWLDEHGVLVESLTSGGAPLSPSSDTGERAPEEGT